MIFKSFVSYIYSLDVTNEGLFLFIALQKAIYINAVTSLNLHNFTFNGQYFQ